jgi:hypothetical protein
MADCLPCWRRSDKERPTRRADADPNIVAKATWALIRIIGSGFAHKSAVLSAASAARMAANAYLGGKTYSLLNGGSLLPAGSSTPNPRR